MILITGATGHFGTDAIDFLLQTTDAAQLAALARHPEKAAPLRAKGIDVRQGDYNDYDSLVRAFQGVEKLLFVSSSDLVNRDAQHANVVKAAQAAGVKHVIYTSFQRKSDDPNSPLGSVAQQHLATEEHLKASGMTYTFLRNSLYMDVLPMFIGDNVLETGTIYLPAGEGKAAYASRRDMAEAAARVLTSEGHTNRSYEIANVTSYSFQDIATLLSDLTGQPIAYHAPSVEVFQKTLSEAGVPEQAIGFTVGFCQAIQQGEFDLPTSDLETLLGHAPTSARDFLKTVYQHA
ncbi:NAD(P)H dehydrogenase (quinone) [Catalinimonas alkaloidigena]|uniref:NAD(P)H dehydrogenase (Quinone) n=1 Tax=Catalinimonas alkaloidigena TaxID=1075417 RepID=A0A1G8ZU22_9BACT|nr:SDR family oxidoreductase [Catalinimonas alkaloidigena]SDK18497.1 NAD(P)H dehydrogenase (quinone) [Catalinimonas alkaloidigena]